MPPGSGPRNAEPRLDQVFEARDNDGEEKVHRDRRDQDLGPLVCGPAEDRVGRVVGVDRKTVRKYVAPAEAAGFTPGGPPVSSSERLRVRSGCGTGRHAVAAGVVAGDRGSRDYIYGQLNHGVTVATIRQLHDQHRLEASVAGAGGCGRICLSMPAAIRCGCCARTRSSPAPRGRSTTASWACGVTADGGAPGGVDVRDGAGRRARRSGRRSRPSGRPGCCTALTAGADPACEKQIASGQDVTITGGVGPDASPSMTNRNTVRACR